MKKEVNSGRHKISLVGVGPGTKDYILPLALREIKKAHCLIGSKRLLSLFNNFAKKKIYLKKNFDKVISYIKRNYLKEKIAILVSGDPTLYSFFRKIQKSFNKDDYYIVPGISVLQVAFAKIKENWEEVRVFSLHGRKWQNSLIEEIKKSKKVFIFTDSNFSPFRIASYLLNKGVDNRKVAVLENLSYPDERVVETDLISLVDKKRKFKKLSVMIIK